MSTLLLTGGSRGIGAATVRLFAEKGYNVAFSYLSSQEEALSLQRELGERVMPFRADCASVAETAAFCRAAEARFGEIDTLVCNAAEAWFGLLTEMTEAQWDRLFAVNVKGIYNAMRELIPGMVRRKAGNIICVSSMWGEAGASCEAAYSASKAAVIGLCKAMAKELAPSGIRVNCVAPGVIDTDMNRRLSAPEAEELKEEIPLGRFGSPREVAETIWFLNSAAYVTGQVINTNGGFII